MIITYHGKQFFKLQQGDFTLAYNPFGKESGLSIKPTRFGANLTLVSVRHPHYNGVESTEFGDAKPFVIQGPGSYEVEGVTINGFATKSLIEDEPSINTIYFVTIDSISYCFVGDIEDAQLDQTLRDFTDGVDVLFVPVGDNGTLSPQQALKVTKIFSPKVVIPMDYGEGRDKESLQIFLKEMNSSKGEEEKFVFKKSDLEKLNSEVVVLETQ